MGRDLLSRFLYGFTDELAANHIEIPGQDLGDTEFFTQIGDLFSGNVNLPNALTATLTAIALMVGSSEGLPAHKIHNRPPPPRYSIRKGLGMWHVTFEGQDTEIRHERGMFYVAWLLLNPPEHPIHAIDLMAKIPEFYRNQLGISALVNPATGKEAILQSHSRIQERNLALDDAQAARRLMRKQRELEALLDSTDASEPEKNEALREYEQITDFLTHHTRRTKDSAQNTADTVRTAIWRLRRRLARATDIYGQPDQALYGLGRHIERFILMPSAKHASGCLTYEQLPATHWSHPGSLPPKTSGRASV